MSDATDRHSSDEEVEEVERMIGAPGGLRIHRDDDVDDVHDHDDAVEEEENGAETHPMQIHNDHDMAEPMVVQAQAQAQRNVEVIVVHESVHSSKPGATPTETVLASELKNLTSVQLAEGVLKLSNHQTHDVVTHELLEYTRALRARLSIERNSPIAEIVEVEGIVERLTNLMRDSDSSQMKFECAWSLSNIASSTHAHTRAVIEAGAIPVFIANLSHSDHDVQEQSVWALGNIGGDSPACRNLVLTSGALPPILALCTVDAKLTLLRNATWSISNLFRGKPRPELDLINTALPTLARLIWCMDDEVLTDACWALSSLSDGTNEQIQEVISAGITRRMVELLTHRNVEVKTSALRTIGNICTGDDRQTQIVLNCSALPCLRDLLNHPKKGIRKEACWTLSNITSGNRQQIQQVIDANIITDLIKCLRDDDWDIQKEAAWALSNASAGGSHAHLRYIANRGAIELFCLMLNQHADEKMVQLALDTLTNFLIVGKTEIIDDDDGESKSYVEIIENTDGRARLERVVNHRIGSDASEAAKALLSTYFTETTQGETTAS